MVTETTETPLLDLIKAMTADSLEASTLDERELMLVRIAFVGTMRPRRRTS